MMGELEREDVMRLCEVSVPEEFGQLGIEISAASLRGMVEKTVRKEEWTRNSELMKECPEDVFPAGRPPERCAQFREV